MRAAYTILAALILVAGTVSATAEPSSSSSAAAGSASSDGQPHGASSSAGESGQCPQAAFKRTGPAQGRLVAAEWDAYSGTARKKAGKRSTIPQLDPGETAETSGPVARV